VGALIFDDSGRILIVERGREPYRGQWSLPGGIVEVGETLKRATEREVLEETGLVVEAFRYFTIFERIVPDRVNRFEYHYVLVDYVCRILEGEPEAGSDVAKVAWASKAELERYDLTEGTMSVIERAYQLGAHLDR
jgi:8-oxo-dGTP diphosphatase